MIKDLLTLRRVLAVIAVLVLLAGAYSAWLAWQTERDLRRAEQAVKQLEDAIKSGDDGARDRAAAELIDAAQAAKGHTDGAWWSLMTGMPVYGDDAEGVKSLSASIDILATDAVRPLLDTVDSLDGLVSGGRIDPNRVAALQDPIEGAAAAMRRASVQVGSTESDGFVSALRTRYDDYARRVGDVAEDLVAAETAVAVLPTMLGSEEPRDYLFVFQNNAEIRSTGGLPGSWARIRVDDGYIELREQGSAGDLNTSSPATTLTAQETAVYDELPALYFQDPNFIPDFPRAAEIFDAFWTRKHPQVELDGVVALDTVSMSYLMAGTGPIQLDDVLLTAENVVPELLSNTYITIADPLKHDERFQQVARKILTASTSNLESPVDFVTGLSRAIRERRLLVAPFSKEESARLAGTSILGELPGDEGSTPHVDVGVNDSTGSKMSYYLRFQAKLDARSCADEVQVLEGELTLKQTISPSEAEQLPDYVTGGGAYGIPRGNQLVTLWIYGPFGGTISDVRVNSKPLDVDYDLAIDGRPVVTGAPIIESVEDVRVTWRMSTGSGQTGGAVLGVTPGLVPGPSRSYHQSAC